MHRRARHCVATPHATALVATKLAQESTSIAALCPVLDVERLCGALGMQMPNGRDAVGGNTKTQRSPASTINVNESGQGL